MPYWQLFYHIVWATKNREPLLTAEVESAIYGYLFKKAIGLEANVMRLMDIRIMYTLSFPSHPK